MRRKVMVLGIKMKRKKITCNLNDKKSKGLLEKIGFFFFLRDFF